MFKMNIGMVVVIIMFIIIINMIIMISMIMMIKAATNKQQSGVFVKSSEISCYIVPIGLYVTCS